MVKKTITVFTPTFNRAYCLHRLYESLLRQTNSDFLWLIVDDGSSDNTGELVNGWIMENRIEIEYVYKENGGMHTAHNAAYERITTELNVCIDSDDYMPDNAIEKILSFWEQNKNEKYAGIIGLDQSVKGEIIGTKFSPELKETTLSEYYAKGGKGDKKLVYRTDVINSVPPYPVFEGEKYVGLAYKYHLIDVCYKLLVLNKVLCIVDYQPDGSSMNMFKQYWNNPKGFAFYRKTEMQLAPSVKRRFIEAVHYVSSSIIAQNKSFYKESPQKGLTLVAMPLGVLLYLFIKYKVTHNKNMNMK